MLVRVRGVTLTSMFSRTIGIALVIGAVSSVARAQSYDATPMLANVRESQRAGLPERLEVARLEQLEHYDLHVAVEDELRAFGLREVVHVTNDERAPWREVALRIFANVIATPGEAPPVSMIAGECLDGVSCTIEQTAPSILVVRPSAPIAPGATLRVQLDLQGRLREIDASRTTMMAQSQEGLAGMMGETGGDYGLLARGEGIASFASFFAVLARRERGRWETDDRGTLGDLGNDRMSHVRARIVVPQGAQLVATGVETGSLPVRDAPGRARRREITVQAGLVRDFSFLVGHALESSARDVNGVNVRSWYLGRDREAGRRVLETAASALEVFERRFGPYPYRELDVVEAALVGGAGGVEFSGLVTVASMFYRPAGLGGLGAMLGGAGAGAVGDMQSAMLEFVTAHEVAHQWWHGLVGSDSRAHPWVDESLAQWSAMLWVEERYGAERARQEGERQVAMGYRTMRMMGVADGAVDRATSEFGPSVAYAGLVYGKGPYLYPALRAELGDEAFFAGLRAYVERYAFRSAPARGPIDTLATGRHAARVRALARHWLDERHGDADLGGGDAGAMLGAMLPPELQGAMQDPAMRAMMEQVLRGLMQGQAQGGAAPGGGGSPEDAARMMQQLEQMLGSLPDAP